MNVRRRRSLPFLLHTCAMPRSPPPLPPPLLTVYLLLFLLFHAPASSNSQALPAWTQHGALLALKSSFSDPYHHLDDWTSSSYPPYCNWTGVSCDQNLFVVSLTLSGFHLYGNLSGSAIALLTSLQHLLLPDNKLFGPIPQQIGQLYSLATLDLSYNGFSDQLPADVFSNLNQLVTLKLAFNQLQGSIPPQLASLPNLQLLELRHNSLNGTIPPSLSSCVSLRILKLENNSLSGDIPAGIGLLPHLKYFSVEHNSLTGSIPADFVNLRGVSHIYAGWNKLNGTIPPQFGNLRRLLYLDLQENDLTGQIPASLGSLTELRELKLYSNGLSGSLPPKLGNLKNLAILDLSGNILNGSIPAEIGNMSSLKTLDLSQNNLSGSINPDLGNLTLLTFLNLSYNNLSGEVPRNGVLSKFSLSSFEGNQHLCGVPLVNRTCNFNPPPRSPPPVRNSPPPPAVNSRGISRKTKIIVSAVSGAFGLALLAFLLLFIMSRRKKPVQIVNRFSPDLSDNVGTAKLQMYVRNFRYSYEEIVANAGYYDTAHVLGKGRFATVYRSSLPGGTRFAVKVFNNYSISQGTFERDIEILESAKFRNLLPIRGYYSNPTEKAIFYDLMPRGTLYDLLHAQGTSSEPNFTLPDWSKRLAIALGIAQAVEYLHRGSNLRLLHKDLKSSNVLLDEDMNPLVADYGLAGLVAGRSTIVETPGYVPPELKSTRKYTEKTDVYSFGVVLLELLTRKKPVSYHGDKELNLVTWVVRLHKDGRGQEVLDTHTLQTCPHPDHLVKALGLAILCLSEQPAQRPTMSEIVSIIESLGGNSSPIRSPGPSADRPLLF